MVASLFDDRQAENIEPTEGPQDDRYKYEQLESFRNGQRYAEQLLVRYETKARELQAKTSRYTP